MIDPTGITVSDTARRRTFDERALAPLGYAMLLEVPREHTGGRVVLGFGVAPKMDFWMTDGAPTEPRQHVEAVFHGG